LIYQSADCLVVDDNAVCELFRSTNAVEVEDTNHKLFQLEAVLCVHTKEDKPLGHMAFSCRALKRSLVYALDEKDTKTLLETGRKLLEEAGYQLERVNLNLSPAMREVVLRNIAGILPAHLAFKKQQDKEHWHQLADTSPESAEGKKAKRMLSAEQRLDSQALALRTGLEGLFGAKGQSTEDGPNSPDDHGDLPENLDQTIALLNDERRRRIETEAILEAAEKRIQELEKLNLDVDAVTADTRKSKQRQIELAGRFESLQKELTEQHALLEKQATEETRLSADLHKALEQVKSLEAELSKEQQKQPETKDSNARIEQIRLENVSLKEKLDDLKRELAHESQTKQAVSAELTGLHQRCESWQAKAGKSDDLAKEAQSAKEQLTLELEQTQNRCRDLEKSLSCANQSFAELQGVKEEKESLQSQLLLLEEELGQLRIELKAEQKQRSTYERESQERGRQLESLKKQVAELAAENETFISEKQVECEQRENNLKSVQGQLDEEVALRERLEVELQNAERHVIELETTLHDCQKDLEVAAHDASAAYDQRIESLNARICSMEVQLEQEMMEHKKTAAAHAQAEKTTSAVQDELDLLRQELKAQTDDGERKPQAKSKEKQPKPLPHEIRPAPPKGALFPPDWDLSGLPCESANQVDGVWESTFNVQLSLEGYPSQYCSAFLVVLKNDDENQLYLVFRLTKNKHTLICRPASAPRNEQEFKKTLQDGLNYLKLSGFDLQKVEKKNIAAVLKGHCLNKM
jgi:hypothetical protein